MLAAGNSKLGPRVQSFSLPPGETCPGATPACASACYARKSFRMYPSVQKVYRRNQSMDLAQIESLSVKPGSIVRIHVSGDFFSAEYILAWRNAAINNPESVFYAYTRSWRIASLLPALEALRARPNVRLFASLDEETGIGPRGWRYAVMGDLAGHAAPGTIICPEQTGKVSTCSDCKLCWNSRVNLTFKMH